MEEDARRHTDDFLVTGSQRDVECFPLLLFRINLKKAPHGNGNPKLIAPPPSLLPLLTLLFFFDRHI